MREYVQAAEPEQIEAVWRGVAAVTEQADNSQLFEAEFVGLMEETTELGLLAEDLFKNAVAALYGHTSDAAYSVFENEGACVQMHQTIHHRALSMLASYMPQGDDMRRIVEMQATAAEFAHIGENARHIADYALILGGMAEAELQRIGGAAAQDMLMRIVRQAYVEMRGCVIASTTRDTALARRLVHEDSELDSLFRAFKNRLDHEIARNPRNAAVLHRLLLVAVHLEEIGNHVVAICRTLLYQPPSTL